MIPEYPWLQPAAAPPDLATWTLTQVKAHIALLQAFGDATLPCDVVHLALPMAAFLSQLASRDDLLAASKAGAHAAYDNNPDEHGLMGEAAWDALVAYAASSGAWVLHEVAIEVARTAAREVAAERTSKAGMDTGSAGGDAGGSWVYVGRENGKYATRAVAQRALATGPVWAALTKAREKAMETTFMSLDPGIMDAAQEASLTCAKLVAKRIAAMASLDDQGLLASAWDLAHEAARHVSWFTTWTPSDAPENPWAPLLTIWRVGLGVFRLIDGRYLVLQSD